MKNEFDLKVDELVLYGTTHGEKSVAKVVKLNESSARLELLEPRGISKVGHQSNVGYSVIKRITQAEADQLLMEHDQKRRPISVRGSIAFPVPQESLGKLKAKPVDPPVYDKTAFIDNLILEGIRSIYLWLELEEIGIPVDTRYTQRSLFNSAGMHRRLKGLQYALGRSVSKEEAYAWGRVKENSR